MGRQESPQLIERKTQVDTDAQETSRASNYLAINGKSSDETILQFELYSPLSTYNAEFL